MRTLNEYFLPLGNCAAIQTDNTVFDIEAVVPDSGMLRSIIMHITVEADDDDTFDIDLNGTDTTEDITVPDETPADSGIEIMLDTPIHVQVGDKLLLRTNGDQTNACVADAIAVIRR